MSRGGYAEYCLHKSNSYVKVSDFQYVMINNVHYYTYIQPRYIVYNNHIKDIRMQYIIRVVILLYMIFLWLVSYI